MQAYYVLGELDFYQISFLRIR